MAKATSKKILWTREYASSGKLTEDSCDGALQSTQLQGDYAIRKIRIDHPLVGLTPYFVFEVSNSPKRASWYRLSSHAACKSWAGQWKKGN